jgi:hypothetical protein
MTRVSLMFKNGKVVEHRLPDGDIPRVSLPISTVHGNGDVGPAQFVRTGLRDAEDRLIYKEEP